MNGIDFEEIHKNSQSLDNGTTHSFSFIEKPALPVGVFYYRIKQCDIDGSCHYSETKMVKISNPVLSLYPVPAQNNLNVRLNSPGETLMTISIVNNMGQTVWTETKKVYTGLNNIYINIKNLQKGNFIIKTINGKIIQQEKFVKL